MNLIRNPKKMKQINNFSGLCFGENRYPTDVDAYMEFGGQLYVFVEVKARGANCAYGQEKALVRLVDIVGRSRPALLIYAEHTEDGPEVDVGGAKVARYRSRREWRATKAPYTVRELIDAFRVHVAEGDPRKLPNL